MECCSAQCARADTVVCNVLGAVKCLGLSETSEGFFRFGGVLVREYGVLEVFIVMG